MIAAGWRRLGVSPAAFVLFGLAVIALLLSRGAGNGWLVVVASALLGAVVVGVLLSVAGIVGVRAALEVPTDATAGDVLSVGVRITAPIAQLRTVTFHALDGSTHPVDGSARTVVPVRAERRGYYTEIAVEIRGGLPLGVVRSSARRTVALDVPLAVAPVPTVVSLIEALGEDPDAEVRTVRGYQPGDAARLVHWRSTARRGELMVREMESAQLLRGARLQLRVTLANDERAEATASGAAGMAIAALDAGMRVELLTHEATGVRSGAVSTRRDVGRRLAAATPGTPPALDATDQFAHSLDLA